MVDISIFRQLFPISMRVVGVSLCVMLAAVVASLAEPARVDTLPGAPKYVLGGTITGFVPGQGIYIALYSTEARFRKRNYDASLRFLPASLPCDSLRYCFNDVSEGWYLVAAFQDSNGNGKLDTGAFGRPVEPYAFFPACEGRFGPSFQRCRLRLRESISSGDIHF